MRILNIDVETASLADLRKTGASAYAAHPSTLITVAAWCFDDGPVQSALVPREAPDEIREHIAAGGLVQAWNAFFEFCIMRSVWGLDIRPEQMSCTMQRAQHAGLPAALGDCGPALGLAIVKDTTAHSLMLRMSRPRAMQPLRWWHEEDADRLDALRQYCVRDVEAEREISRVIPPLPAREQTISIIDRRANARGVLIDVPAIEAMLEVVEEAMTGLNEECARITGGAVKSPGSRTQALISFLGDYGADLTKDGVTEALKRDDLPDDIRRVLQLRKMAARGSVKKLQAMLDWRDPDDAMRGLLAYYGASRTGRWSGRGPQIQNLARPTIKKPNDAIDFMLAGADAAAIDAFYGAPLDVVASCLRGVLVPRPGKRFVVFDLSQIEARVLAWLAGQNDAVEVFRRGEDIYTHAQKTIGLNSRQEGKVATLGLGFGMGPNKFIDTAATYGLTFTEERAVEIVAGWREANDKIVQFWWACDRGLKELIRATWAARGKAKADLNDFVAATISPARNGSPLLTLRLPSGRSLFYRDIRLTPYEDATSERTRFAITYSGVDQITRKWGPIRTYGGRTVENIVQATARDVVAEMAVEIETAGMGELLLSVHDELIVEVPEDEAEARYAAIKEVMNRAPSWAPGLPVAAEGHVLNRYGK